MARKDPSTLRDEAAKAVERGKFPAAIAAYAELEQRQPLDAQWPKRAGEVHRRAGASGDAIAAFERAVDKYVAAGFLVQAIAVCKLILQIDPAHQASLERLGAHAPAPVRRAPPPVTVPPGAGLDAVPLAAIVPGAHRARTADGLESGVIVIPLEDADVVEMIVDDPSRGTAIDAAIALAEPDAPLSPPMPGPAARRALLATPLLAALPPRALESLVARLSLVELGAGEVLFREGDAGGALFVVSEGEVQVETRAGGALATLGPGSFLGEISLVTDLPRSATIRAALPAVLLSIDRGVVRELVAEHPAVLSVILRFVRDRLVAKVMRESELFRPFDDAERAALTARFELCEVEAGTPIVVQGARADGLYLLLAGRAEVWRDGATSQLATLVAGEVFGEMSLLSASGATAHVRAATKVLALRMPAATFREVIMTHPQVLAFVGELAERRSGPAAASDADFVDLHLDLL